jgi:uncharacterized protein YkwD
MRQKITAILILGILVGINISQVFAYPDVSSFHQNYEAITYLTENSIVKGYPDGTFGPNNLINRAEFLKIVVEGVVGTPEDPSNGCFPDVQAGEWYTKYVCRAKNMGVIQGYPDGYYRPANNINLVEALKIVVEAYNIPTQAAQPWYAPYVNIMSESRYIPDSFYTLDQKVKRGEMAEIIWRLLEDIKDEPFITADELNETDCNHIGDDMPPSVDMDRVRQAWLNTLNTERGKEGLHSYTLNDQLNRTAADWSKYMRDRGYIDHKRPGVTEYYNYNNIKQWFLDRGLDFANVYRVTFSENIGAGSFSCSLNDCTNHVIANMQPTFDMYMAEKYKEYKPHYSSVMNGYFNEIGVGVAIDGSKMYITTHYGTEIISDPIPICEERIIGTTSEAFGYYRPQ